MYERTRRLALSLLFTTTTLAAADPFGLAPAPEAAAPVALASMAPEELLTLADAGGPMAAEAEWTLVDRVVPILGMVVYPIARRLQAHSSPPAPLGPVEKAYARRVFAGFAEADREALIGKMRIRYEAPMRTPWSEFQRIKTACQNPPEGFGSVVQALAKVSFLGYGPCDLLTFSEDRGWIDYLPKVIAGAQALGPEIYVGKKLDIEDRWVRETLYHEMEHVKQWWESRPGSSDLMRDISMGRQYFQAHVDAGYQYQSNRLEVAARAAGGRLERANQVRP